MTGLKNPEVLQQQSRAATGDGHAVAVACLTFTEASLSLGPVHVGFVVQGQVLHFLLSMSCRQLPYTLTVTSSVIMTVMFL